MDNPILQSLWDRKSTRVFLEKPITKEAQEIILGAAMQAPTAGNQMLYTILQITDQNLKERLAETCDHQPFIAKAPLVLVFLADFQRWYDAFASAGCHPRLPAEGDLMLAVADACIAAQNSVVAAQSLGIGSCYIGDILEQVEIHRELLDLPDYVMPAAMVVYGYPTDQQQNRKKPERFAPALSRSFFDHQVVYAVRLEQAERLVPEFFESEHEKWFCERAEREKQTDFSYPSYMDAFCKRKYLSAFSREMSRSVAVYLEKFKHS